MSHSDRHGNARPRPWIQADEMRRRFFNNSPNQRTTERCRDVKIVNAAKPMKTVSAMEQIEARTNRATSRAEREASAKKGNARVVAPVEPVRHQTSERGY